MSTHPAPVRPGKRGYVIGAVLAVLGLVIAAIVVAVIGRALAGYEITPFDVRTPTTITVGDRGEAIWMSPDQATGSCTSVGEQTGEDSLTSGTASEVTTTDAGRTWTRVGIVEGEPGSRHVVTCDGAVGAERFGHAANPRIGHYLVIGIAGGGAAGLLGLAAFVLVLVTAIRRSKASRAA